MNDFLDDRGSPLRLLPAQVINAYAAKISQSLVKIVGLTFCVKAPDEAWHRIDQHGKFAFALGQRFLRTHQIIDINADTVPLEDRARLVAQRFGPGFSPPIGAVCSYLPVSLEIWLVRRQ